MKMVMRWLVFFATNLVIVLLPCSVFADVSSNNQAGKIIIQIQGGPDFPLSNNYWSNSYDLSGECVLGYSINENITLGLLSGYHNYNHGTGTSTTNGIASDINSWLNVVPLEAMAQFNIGRNKLRPYFLLGAGVCFNITTLTQTLTSSNGVEVYNAPPLTNIDFLIEPGLGLSYELLDNFNIFAQAKLTMDFVTSNYINLYLPVEFGCNISI